MKRLSIIIVFLLTNTGFCLADYDYYSKRTPPQNCADVKAWEIELIQELTRLNRESTELTIEKLKPGDNAPTFNKRQAYEVKKSMWNDEYKAMKEYLESLCGHK